MKRIGLWIGLLLASLASASAQVKAEITLEQEQFLSGESLPISVRVINRSGQVLHLGDTDNWLTFEVSSREDGVVNKLAEVPVKGEFDLESSKAAVKRVDIQPYFALSEAGRYYITATVRLKHWGTEIVSAPQGFNIIDGVKLTELTVGLPKAPGSTNASPELRKYVLHKVNYQKGKLRLYLRVTDEAGSSLRVFPIAPMVSFGRPDAQVDRESNLHVLNQTGPSSFNYAVFSPDGEWLRRQTYDYVAARPRLSVDEHDEIVVIGGVRHFSDTDLPAPISADSTNAADSTNTVDSASLAGSTTNTVPSVPSP